MLVMTKDKLVVGMPFIESAVHRVTEILDSYLDHVETIALPLPRNLCYEIALAGLRRSDATYSDLNEIALRYMGRAHLRVWRELLVKISQMVNQYPHKDLNCYLSDQSYIRSQEIGYRLAELVLRYRITGGRGVKPVEWIKIYRSRDDQTDILKSVRSNDLIILDEYKLFKNALKTLKTHRKLLAKKPLIPTPVELLDLLLDGEIPLDRIEDIAGFIARYLGEYIVTSKNYDEAYQKLIRDREYTDFINDLDLNIYE